jgi:hypothetical protein
MKFSFTVFTRLSTLAILSLFIFSCEQIINVNLPESSPRVVIEGYVTNGKGPFTIKISQSQSYFNQSDFKGISSAVVEISDGHFKEKLKNTGSGIYFTTQMFGTAGKTYNLSVTLGKNLYTASTVLPSVIPIDTLYFEEGFLNRDSLNAFVQFKDPGGIENNYRIVAYRNNYFISNDYNLVNDTYTDGQTFLAPVYRNFAPGDTVIVDLYNIDKCTWKYYRGLNDILQQGPGLQSPGNPPSNISGGALGYFGAWGKSSFKIIVPKHS